MTDRSYYGQRTGLPLLSWVGCLSQLICSFSSRQLGEDWYPTYLDYPTICYGIHESDTVHLTSVV